MPLANFTPKLNFRSCSMESKVETGEELLDYLEHLELLREGSTFLDNSLHPSNVSSLSFKDKAQFEDSIQSADISNHSINAKVSETACSPFNSDLYQHCPNPRDASKTSLSEQLEASQKAYQHKLLESFIPGAMWNRTVEHLTESTIRSPSRAITGNKFHADLPTSRVDQNPFGAGTIGEGSSKLPHSYFSHPLLDAFNAMQNSSFSESNASDAGTYSNQQNACYPPSSLNQTLRQAINGCTSSTMSVLKALGFQSDSPMPSQTLPTTSQRANAGYNDFSISADLFANRPWPSLDTLFFSSARDPHRAAKLYKNAATLSNPTITWCGKLPTKKHRSPIYSPKVFLGGMPWDITESGLQNCFKAYGPMRVEWPGKDGKHPRHSTRGKELPVGYVYILFEHERSVKALLQACSSLPLGDTEYYYKVSSRKMRSKEVQVIPWSVTDSNYIMSPYKRLEARKTVFVGALHGMMTAEGLALILDDLFGNVLFSGIDTDKYKYPIGSGRVTFSSFDSYYDAVTAAFVTVKTSKFTKKIQIDPYLEESQCDTCQVQSGIYFCRNFKCFMYYCKACWQKFHSADCMRYHKPLMKNHNFSGASRVVDFESMAK